MSYPTNYLWADQHECGTLLVYPRSVQRLLLDRPAYHTGNSDPKFLYRCSSYRLSQHFVVNSDQRSIDRQVAVSVEFQLGLWPH